jgi:hypothetical protein
MINKTSMMIAAALTFAVGCDSVTDPTDLECDPALEACDIGDGDGDGDGDLGDPVPPTLRVIPTEILDERADQVTFDAQGAPTDFTHTGDPSVLGGEECGAVFKHAFLLDPNTEATESPANPLRFTFFVVADPRFDPDTVTGDYRVRRMGESEFLNDWTPATPIDAGEGGASFAADLDIEAVPELAFEEGLFEVELRGTDPQGSETTAVRCFDHQPLGGPIKVSAATALTSGTASLAGLRLASNHPISPVLNGAAAAGIMRFTLTNGTPHETYASLTVPRFAGSCTKRWKQFNVLISVSNPQTNCASNPSACDQPTLGATLDKTEQCDPQIAAIASKFEIRVERAGSLVSPCAGCAGTRYLLPADSVTTVIVRANDLPGLQPRSASESERLAQEISLAHRTNPSGLGSCTSGATCKTINFTGDTSTRTGCSRTALVLGNGVACVEKRSHKIVRALQSIAVNIAEVSVDIDVGANVDGNTFEPAGQDPSPSVTNYGWTTTETGLP